MSLLPTDQLALTLLCVDDEETHRTILQRFAAPMVSEVLTAVDGLQGRDVFAERRPDIVLTDLMMPGMNGLEMSRAIREIDPHVPIILMTSGGPDFFSEAVDTGISQFLPKPILKAPLSRSLQRCYEMIDIRRRLEQEQERTDILSNALEQSPTAVVILDPAGRVDFMNRACVLRYGWVSEDVLGKNFLEMTRHEELNRLVVRVMDGTPHVGADISISLPGREQSNAAASISLFKAGGGGSKILITLDDITDRKAMEAHLLSTQKFESLGIMAGGVAHNFNNILTAIVGNAELTLMRLPPESPLTTSIEAIKSSALRAARLSSQMLAYTGKGMRTREEFDLNSLLENMLSVFEVSVSKQIDIKLELTPEIPPITADSSQIREVLMSLIINSSEAIGEMSGRITISTGCATFDRSQLAKFWLGDHLPPGRYVSLMLSDTGCGMDNATVAKLFDPFFSTKFTGRGLGMAAVVGNVKGSGGAITVSTLPGKGTSFTILLPVRSQET
ncbi:MAG: response regulator [Desulfuromonadales bacterium]